MRNEPVLIEMHETLFWRLGEEDVRGLTRRVSARLPTRFGEDEEAAGEISVVSETRGGGVCLLGRSKERI